VVLVWNGWDSDAIGGVVSEFLGFDYEKAMQSRAAEKLEMDGEVF